MPFPSKVLQSNSRVLKHQGKKTFQSKSSFNENKYATRCINAYCLLGFRFKLFQDRMGDVTSSELFDGQMILTTMLAEINNGLPDEEQFSVTEAESALQVMADRNQIMYSGGIVYRI